MLLYIQGLWLFLYRAFVQNCDHSVLVLRIWIKAVQLAEETIGAGIAFCIYGQRVLHLQHMHTFSNQHYLD